jgi:hypothetical protein
MVIGDYIMHAAPWFASLVLAFGVLPAGTVSLEAESADEAPNCKALSSQIKDLTKRQAKAERKRERGAGGGLFASLNRVAMPMLDSVVSETGGATMAAADGARQGLRGAEEAEAAGAQGGAAPAPADEADLADQLARLKAQHAATKC